MAVVLTLVERRSRRFLLLSLMMAFISEQYFELTTDKRLLVGGFLLKVLLDLVE